MSARSRVTACCVAALLSAVPAAWACDELGAMKPHCPMMRSMETAGCHGVGEMSMDCCAARSVPEPVQALSADSAKLLRPLGVTHLEQAVLPALSVVPSPTGLAEDPAPPGLGRCSLFSALLL